MKIKVEFEAIRPDFMKVDYEGRVGNIWEKRKCFICGGKFKQGELVTALFTKNRGNKLSCSTCYQKNKEEWGKYISILKPIENTKVTFLRLDKRE